jgi:hypothetical protein
MGATLTITLHLLQLVIETAKLKTPDLRQYPLTTLIKLLPRNW